MFPSHLHLHHLRRQNSFSLPELTVAQLSTRHPLYFDDCRSVPAILCCFCVVVDEHGVSIDDNFYDKFNGLSTNSIFQSLISLFFQSLIRYLQIAFHFLSKP
jgi:hypothetical protein